MLEPLKYIIQAVAYERDPESGRVVREIMAQPLTVFSAEEASQAILNFEQNLAAQQVPPQLSQNGAEASLPVVPPVPMPSTP